MALTSVTGKIPLLALSALAPAKTETISCNGNNNDIGGINGHSCHFGDNLCNGQNNLISTDTCEDGNDNCNGNRNEIGFSSCEDGNNNCNGNRICIGSNECDDGDDQCNGNKLDVSCPL